MGIKYTKEEDDIIIKAVRKCPENLKRAFERASKKIGRSPNCIKQRYYGYLAKNSNNKLFLTVSSGKKYTNYKIKRKGMKAKPVGTEKSKWRQILDILFG